MARKPNIRKTTQRRITKTTKARPKNSLGQRLRLWRFPELTPAVARLGVLGSVLLVFCGAVLWVVAYLSNPNNLRIQALTWQGDFQYVQREALEAIAQPFIETNLFLLDSLGLEAVLEDHVWVRDVSFRKVWPNELSIMVEAQVPAAFWGEQQLLNRFGEIFNGTLPEKKGVFPVVYSPLVNGRTMGERYVKLRQVFKGLNLQMSELTEDQNGSWRLRFRQGPEVIIGRKERAKRIRRLKVAYQRELHDNFTNIERIDLRYTNGFAVEWKQGFRNAAVNPMTVR